MSSWIFFQLIERLFVWKVCYCIEDNYEFLHKILYKYPFRDTIYWIHKRDKCLLYTYAFCWFSGHTLIGCYLLLTLSFITFYNIDFRSYLIGQRLEKPISKIEDVDFWQTDIFFIFGTPAFDYQLGSLENEMMYHHKLMHAFTKFYFDPPGDLSCMDVPSFKSIFSFYAINAICGNAFV